MKRPPFHYLAHHRGAHLTPLFGRGERRGQGGQAVPIGGPKLLHEQIAVIQHRLGAAAMGEQGKLAPPRAFAQGGRIEPGFRDEVAARRARKSFDHAGDEILLVVVFRRRRIENGSKVHAPALADRLAAITAPRCRARS